ncbi:hypothetical protein R1flu_028436 [Riccia fluitans]|uniref:NB-ARC domain-containing protein n=1 Tax=Riccia fluitans TaxID=41844 RepID=A0ABD1XLN2_9MARC
MYKKTWMTRSGEELWPAAWLPIEDSFSKASMYSVKFDSSATQGNEHGRFRMRTLVEYLALNLIELGNIGQTGVPVVLVGHDVGGLVIKELCLYLVKSLPVHKQLKTEDSHLSNRKKLLKYKNFLRCLIGVFYFATPHHGVRIASEDTEPGGGLLRNLEILDPDTAVSNDEFRTLRQQREWGARGVGPANDDPEGLMFPEEASMRYDADHFFLVSETTETITRLESRDSTVFQFFVESLKEFKKQDDCRLESQAENALKDKGLKDKVGVERVVAELMRELCRQQEANTGTSAVVIHGIGGIGKSTLCEAMFSCLGSNKRQFPKTSKCYVDREVAKNSPSPVMQMQLELLGNLEGTYSRKTEQLRKLLRKERLMQCYRDKKSLKMPLLIVIDGIENKDEPKELFPDNIGGSLPKGSHIIVATRNSEVGRIFRSMGVQNLVLHEMQELDAKMTKTLFYQHAFGGEEETSLIRVPSKILQTYLPQVLKVCAGLPLALEVVGTSLRQVIDEGCEEQEERWEGVIKALQEWKSVDGSREDRLQQCLEASYKVLDEELQRVFLDIAVCFNGSPWKQLRIQYGERLRQLKQRALIKEGTASAEGQEYCYVKIHPLVSSFACRKGRDMSSHFIETVADCNTVLTGYTALPGVGKNGIALVLQGKYPLSRRKFSSSATTFCTHLRSVVQKISCDLCVRPEVGAVSLPISRLSAFASSLRILVLNNVNVEGTFASANSPHGLEFFGCVNSTVPFAEGNFALFKKLLAVDVSTRVDGNSTYWFAATLQRLRLESPCLVSLRLEPGACNTKELGLISSKGLHLPNGHGEFPELRKLIIRCVLSLTELPFTFYGVRVLESLSIQGCDNLKELPSTLEHLEKLKHFHISLKYIKCLPKSIVRMKNLVTLSLEDCFSLEYSNEYLPPGIERTSRLELLAIKGCPKLDLNCLKEILLPAFTVDHRHNWRIFHRKEATSVAELMQEAAAEKLMLSVMLKPKQVYRQTKAGRLFLCGAPYAGKTRLSMTMLRTRQRGSWWWDSPILMNTERTTGVEVRLLETDDSTVITVWDFPGQWIYRTIQDIVFPRTSQPCVFLFVFSPMGTRNKGHRAIETLETDFKDELKFWLRFIASKSQGRLTGHKLPKVWVVISHKDRFQAHSVGLGWAGNVVRSLRSDFQGVVDLCREDEVDFINCFSREDVEPLTDKVVEELKELLREEADVIPEPCFELISICAHPSKQMREDPVWDSSKLYDFFQENAQIPRRFDETENEEHKRIFKALATYLHDVGCIVSIPGPDEEDLVIVEPSWLTHNFLGELIHLGHVLSQSSAASVVHQQVLDSILKKFHRQQLSKGIHVSEENLYKILENLNLCYKLEDGGHIAPFLISDEKSHSSSAMIGKQEEHSLSWNVDSPGHDVDHKYFGFRMQCSDSERTLLTVSFFSRFQVRLRNRLRRRIDHDDSRVISRRGLTKILEDRHQIFVESDGTDGDHIDIMVRSLSATSRDAREFVYEHIIDELRKFCATPEGCPGVSLALGVIRTECVRDLTPLACRGAVLVEDLSRVWIEDSEKKLKVLLSSTVPDEISMKGRTWIKDSLNFQFPWPPISEVMRGSFELAKDLLPEEYLEGVKAKLKNLIEQQSNLQDSASERPLRPTNEFQVRQISDELYEVYAPPDRRVRNIELVFIHGLQDVEFEEPHLTTWSTRADRNTCWLNSSSWLPQYLPLARILSVSIDASPVRMVTMGRQELDVIAENLIYSLVHFGDIGQDCPVVLVGHGLGGLVAMEICTQAHFSKPRRADDNLFEKFLDHIQGLFFFSTPLRGPFSELFSGERRVSILRESRYSIDRFSGLRREYGWHTAGVVESNEAAYQDWKGFLVTVSADGDFLDSLTVIPDTDHFTICRPEEQTSSNFLLLVNFIKDIIEESKESQYHATHYNG